MKGVTNIFYKILIETVDQQDVLKTLWELSDRRISKCAPIRIKENVYKLVWRWYLTPMKINHIDTKYSNLCWRGYQEVGPSFHWNILTFSKK